jgi:hypothetical protein
MYAIIGMGEEPQNLEITCMFFETKQAAEAYIAKIPWLRRDASEEDLIFFEIPEELYEETIPPALLATLPQNIIERAKPDITYGQAAGLHFFSHYNDRRTRIAYYALMEVSPSEKLVGFEGAW